MLQAMPAENEAITGYAIALDRRVLLFAIGISCITGIIFGLVPALRASRVEVMEKLGGTGRSSSGSIGLRRLRNSLVVAQVALSFALLAGAGLMIKSLRLIYGAPEGIQTQNLMVLNLILPTERYSTGARQAPLFAGIEERVAATPGVTGVTVATGVPPDVRLGEGGDFEIEGRAISQSDKNLEIPSDGYRAELFPTAWNFALARQNFLGAGRRDGFGCGDHQPKDGPALLARHVSDRRAISISAGERHATLVSRSWV